MRKTVETRDDIESRRRWASERCRMCRARIKELADLSERSFSDERELAHLHRTEASLVTLEAELIVAANTGA